MDSPYDIAIKDKSYKDWVFADLGDNQEDISRMKKALPIALKNYITETQRKYILAYFGEGLSMKEIGKRYNVNRATVSRTINRGLDRLYDVLRFTSPKYAEQFIRDSFRISRTKGHTKKRTKRSW